MSFIKNHEPKSLNELVFHDANVRTLITEYAQGERTKHLLLHGPVGTGKTIASKMIYDQRTNGNGLGKGSDILNGRVHKNFKSWEPLKAAWQIQRMHLSRPFAVLDEVDRFSDSLVEQLDEFLETDAVATLLMTTNNLHELEPWFTSRCKVIEVKRPTVSDLHSRSKSILAKEGYQLTDQQISLLLTGFNGDLRTLVEWLENYSLKLKPYRKATARSGVSLKSPNIKVSYSQGKAVKK